MQTFLPYPDFEESAKSLDRQRLGKQRVENLQVMAALLFGRVISSDENGKPLPEDEWKIEDYEPKGWTNHPVARMWRGHELALFMYQEAVCREWMARGYADTCLAKSAMIFQHGHKQRVGFGLPAWFGDEALHISHQSNLIRKDPEYYEIQFPGVPSDLDYIWPEEAQT